MTRKGFTLIELLAVVLVVGILTAIAVPQYRKSLERSRLAEATQMLPAIQDARDRLIFERGYNWTDLASNASIRALITFPKLDIAMKGHVNSGNASLWETDNFTYQLFRVNGGGTLTKAVAATLKKGAYKNVLIVYDGGSFVCSGSSGACDALNLTEEVTE